MAVYPSQIQKIDLHPLVFIATSLGFHQPKTTPKPKRCLRRLATAPADAKVPALDHLLHPQLEPDAAVPKGYIYIYCV